MDSDIPFMREAIAQARIAQAAGEVPVGAVVVRDGKIIGMGRNAPIAQTDPTAHAEVMALRDAARKIGNYRLDGCTLYVTLEPCVMCTGAIFHSRLARVVFGANDPKTGSAGSVADLYANQTLNHQTRVVGDVMAEECGSLLQEFFKNKRQEKAIAAQPLREDALRTPMAAFALQPLSGVSHYFVSPTFTNGWRMHYLVAGEPELPRIAICIHDLPGDCNGSQHLFKELVNHGCRVIAPDLIGFGRSDKPKKESAHTISMHVQSLRGLMAEISKSNFIFIGVGQGAKLAEILRAESGFKSAPFFSVRTHSKSNMDMTAFPDRGYQAALRANSDLVAALSRSVCSLPKDPTFQLADDQLEFATKLSGLLCHG